MIHKKITLAAKDSSMYMHIHSHMDFSNDSLLSMWFVWKCRCEGNYLSRSEIQEATRDRHQWNSITIEISLHTHFYIYILETLFVNRNFILFIEYEIPMPTTIRTPATNIHLYEMPDRIIYIHHIIAQFYEPSNFAN